MTLIDIMEVVSGSMVCQKARLNAIYKKLIDTMLPYQDQATDMRYQVINQEGIVPNYLKESGSAIFAYAIMKSTRLYHLSDDYFRYDQKAFGGICSTYLSEENGSPQLGGICLVAGLGNTDTRGGAFEYYMREPMIENEARRIAPLILAYIETMFRRQPWDSSVNSGIDSGTRRAAKVIEPMSYSQYNDTGNNSFAYFSPSVPGKART